MLKGAIHPFTYRGAGILATFVKSRCGCYNAETGEVGNGNQCIGKLLEYTGKRGAYNKVNVLSEMRSLCRIRK